MIIPDERLKEFQAAYKKDYREDITLDEAREMLQRLVTFYELISRPLPEDDEEISD